MSLLSFLLLVLMGVVMFVCMASLINEGMWSNAILLINVVTAALLASSFFEPLACWMESKSPAASYVCDFVALWGVFIVSVLVFRNLTDRLSKVKVRFLKIADQIGSTVFAFWISWVMICFTMMTLHTAPLAKNFLYEGFQPEERMILGLAPDRQWLGFIQKMSLTTFSRSGTPEDWQPGQEKFIFDRNADFMPKYNTRRQNVEALVKDHDTILAAPSK
jgi:hypothetical protein